MQQNLQVCGTGRLTSDQGRPRGTKEPGKAVRMMVYGGAKGGRSEGGVDRSADRDGEMGSEAGGGAGRSISLGDAGEQKTCGLSTEQNGVRREVKGLKGTSGGEAERLAGSGCGGSRGRLGGINDDEIVLIQGDKTDFMLGRTNSDNENTGNLVLGKTGGLVPGICPKIPPVAMLLDDNTEDCGQEIQQNICIQIRIIIIFHKGQF